MISNNQVFIILLLPVPHSLPAPTIRLASGASATMKPSIGKLHIPVITLVICSFAFVALLYADSSRSFFKPSSCSRKYAAKKSKEIRTAEEKIKSLELIDDTDQHVIVRTEEIRTAEENIKAFEIDDRFEFDQEECSVNSRKWVFNKSIKPFYTDRSCPYLDRQVSCVKNGRPDSDYRHWEWQPDDCVLPRFNPELALKKLQGKRLLFVGDSLQRGQWQSFVCMVEWIIPEDKKSMKRGHFLSVFTAQEYNATIEFYWAPYLVESNTDLNFIGDLSKRILRVNSVYKHAKNWDGVDILVFNTYVWWMSGPTLNTLWHAFENGEQGHEVLDTPVAYKIGLKTWANWVDSNINPNKTRVFFTTMSPMHSRSADWNSTTGLKCFNETKPVMKKRYWGSGSDKRMMSVVADVVGRMKVPVTVVNITQLSEYRIDGHTSVYTETGGKLLTDDQKADPLHHADCIHWCLPGVPDTWNQIFLAYL